jgi:hypothetical protein
MGNIRDVLNTQEVKDIDSDQKYLEWLCGVSPVLHM